jgi:hypothetical protein
MTADTTIRRRAAIRRITSSVMWGFIMILWIALNQSHAQDFKKVVDIIVGMEASLKKELAQEQNQRKSDIESLKAELQALRMLLAGGHVSPAADLSTTQLAARMDSLERRLGLIQPAQDISAIQEKLLGLVTEFKGSLDQFKTAQQTAQKSSAATQPPVQMSGVFFGFFSYTHTGIDGKDFNRFDFDRVYLTSKCQLFEQGKVQLTSDVFRNSATGSYYAGLSVRLKFAYFDYAPATGVSIKIGMIPTHWFGLIDQYWKYRGLAASVADRAGYISSADLGFSVAYALPGKFGELSGYMFNGNGYAAPETNRFKDVAFRLNVSPFPDDPALKQLLVAGHWYKGSNISTTSLALPRDRYGVFLSYGYSFATIGVEYDVRKDALLNPDTLLTGNAFSIFGEIKSPWEEWRNAISLVWRHDILEPDVDKGGDMTRFTILGLAYKLHEKVTLVLDRQWTKAETESLKRNDGTKTDYDDRWLFHMIINF